MGDRRCCCVCVVYSDDFNRKPTVPDQDIGDWIEASNDRYDWGLIGNWEIVEALVDDMWLVEDGNAGAIVIYDKQMPSDFQRASVKMMTVGAGDIYRVYIAWKDESNHLYGQYTQNVDDTFTLSLHKVVDGDDTELDSTVSDYSLNVLGPNPRLGVCNNLYGFTVYVTDAETCVARSEYVHIHEGYWSGLGHGNSHATGFDDWELIETDDGENGCPPCVECTCDGKPVNPYKLIATYQGTGDCDTLDGIEVELIHQKCVPDESRYEGVVSGGTCLDGVCLTLVCGAKGPETWLLTICKIGCVVDGLNLCCTNDMEIARPMDESSTCDPLMLVIKEGPYANPGTDLCPDGCLPCGTSEGAGGPDAHIVEYTITITDPS